MGFSRQEYRSGVPLPSPSMALVFPNQEVSTPLPTSKPSARSVSWFTSRICPLLSPLPLLGHPHLHCQDATASSHLAVAVASWLVSGPLCPTMINFPHGSQREPFKTYHILPLQQVFQCVGRVNPLLLFSRSAVSKSL